MTGLASINGYHAAQCVMTIGATGIPFVDVEITEETVFPDVCTVVLGGLTLIGYPQRQGAWQGRTQARVVAGRGGWSRVIPPRGYGSPSGVMLAQVIGDAARTVGETVGVVPSVNVGSHYLRVEGPAAAVLDLCAPLDWWVDLSGVLQVGTRTGGVSSAPFELIDWDQWTRRAVIGCEDNSRVLPGATLVSSSAGTITVNTVRWSIGTGTLRGEIWATD